MKANVARLVFLVAFATISGTAVESAAGKEAAPLPGVVIDQQDRAIAGADVVYSWWNHELKNQAVATKSDEHGRFVLDPPPDVEGAEWPQGEIWAGIPGRRLTHRLLFQDGQSPIDLRLVLPEAANVAVFVAGLDGKGVAGAKMTLPVIIGPEQRSQMVPREVHPWTETTTDHEGKARITAFARDELLQVRVVSTKLGTQSCYLAPHTDTAPVEITISLRPVGRVHGRLVAPDANVVEGVRIWLSSDPTRGESTGAEATATTGKDGRFEIPVIAAGIIRDVDVEQKAERAFLPTLPNEVAVAAGRTAELTILLEPAVRVRGIMRETVTRKPISDVMIGVNERHGSSVAAVTGEDGRFQFLRLPGPLNMYLQFSKRREVPGWFQHRFYQLPGGKTDFDLPTVELAVARGRVVDAAGRPVAGANIEKVESKFNYDGTWVENPVVWDTGGREFSTDANGEYRAWVEVGAPYRVQVGVAGRASQWTEWTEVAADAAPVFPDTVIGSLWSIAGQVVDRQGRPVPHVNVFQSGDGPERTEATSDADGRFNLTGYQNELAFIFAQKEGFRFHGQPLKAGDAEVRIVLARTDEPPERRLTTPAAGDPASELALARQILQPALDGLAKQDDERERWAVLGDLADVDPAAALEQMETLGIKGGRAEMLRGQIAKQLSAKHPDEAAAIIEAFDDAYSRAAGYVMSAEGLPASQHQRRLDWLGKARLHLRGAGDPMMRTALTAYMARLMTESGDAEGARKLIATIKPEVERLPYDGVAAYVRGVTAEALAAFEVPAALSMIKDVKDNGEYDRHHGNIARIAAPAHPAEAVAALKLIRDAFQRDQFAVHVASSLATVDRAQADASVMLIENLSLKALAQGLMADALSKSDPQAAAAQIERAYEALAKTALGDAGYDTSPVLAAWFLPIVEKLAPDRLNECVWRSLALRKPLSRQGDNEQSILLSRAYLSIFLARYDHELARGLYGDLVAEAFRNPGAAGAATGMFAAAAMIDPKWAAEQYEKLPIDLPYNARRQARGALVRVLSKQGEARWRAVSEELRMPMPWHGVQ
jgi:hypothetical protein